MKTTKRLLVLLLSLVTVFAVGMTVACSKEDSSGDSSTGGGNTPIFETLSGDFYAEIADGDEIITVTLKFADNFGYELTVNGDTHTGKYALTGSALKLFENDEPKYEAVYADGMILLTFGQTQYRLLIDRTFEVTFTADGATIKTVIVRNGKTVAMPDAPEKAGHKFIGWFKDAAFNTPFIPTEQVGATLTLYAKYQSIEAKEYNVTYFDTNGGTLTQLATVTTTNKTLAALLENDNASFAGWWTSDTLNPAQLTARFFAGATLTEDICLYAVYNEKQPSLSATGATWAGASGKMYTATLTDPDGATTQLPGTGLGASSAPVTFGKSGLYTLEVKEGAASIGKAYYVHNRLPRPSALAVSGNELLFAAVDGATEYELTVECGDGTHKVTLKDKYSYDFSDCKMPAEGIKFTVTAKAEGYSAADSVPYVLKRNLDEVESLTYNKEKARIEWSAVDGAEEYEVTLTYGGKTTTFTTQDLFYGVADKTGSIKLSVKPAREGYNSPKAKELVLNRTEQITPTGLSYAYLNGNDTVSWTAVPGANGYKIIATGKNSSKEPKVFDNIKGTSYEFKVVDLAALGEEMEIQVIAKGATAENDSYPAFLKIRTTLDASDITYENGILSWSAVRRATSYTVNFPDGTTKTVEGATYCETPEFTTAGKNAFTVTDNTINKNSATLYIDVYALMFETNGSTVDTQYKAKGDEVTLPDGADRIGYEFLGWYNASDDSTALKYGSSFTFNATSSITVFAGWDPCKYQLTLDVAGGAALDQDEKVKEVTYKKTDTVFPVPGLGADTSKLFLGWYSAPNGQGTRYVDQYGKMVKGYNMTEDATLYAYWPTAFEFEANEVENGEIESYKVKKGRDIDLFADGEVTVPAYYNGKKVNYIKGGAFEDCKFKILNLPQTMYTIEILVSETGTAFAGCSKLEAINVYVVSGYTSTLIRYFSHEGVLYFENEDQVANKENTELAFVPRAKTGLITIPEGVEIIPAGTLGLYAGESTFASHKFTDVVVPYTVTTIGDKAFAQSTYLKTVVFEQAPANITAKPLNFGKDVFKGCSNLETVELPNRIASFSATMFNGCLDLVAVNIEKGGKDYKSVDGVVFTADGKKLVYFPRGIEATEDSPSLGKYVVPEGVEVIGSNAFSGSRLTELVISAGVKTIEPYAFGGVADEKGASLTGNLKGNYYGNPMPLLETLTFVGSDDHTLEIGEGAFFYAGGGLGSGKLAEVTLPRNLTKLGEYAFAGRGAIKTVTIELDGNKYSDGFDYADTAFYISEKVSNPWVTTVNIGKDVPAMESLSALFGGNQLETINVDENNTNYQFDDGVLYDKDADGKKTKILYYLDSREGAYVLPETITEIPAGTFRRKGNVVEVTLHAGVKYIGDEAFLSCGNLTSITILGTPEGGDVVELILGNDVFNGCSELTSVNLPNRTRKLGKGVFMGCRSLTELVIPEGVTELGDGMFSKNSLYASSSTYDMKLVSVTLPSTLEKFGNYVKDAEGNEVLDSLNAFEGCNSLETINVNSGNKYFASVNGILYNGSLNDQNVFVPEQLIVCPVNLTSDSGETLVLTVPGTVTRIWTGAFKNNKNVSSITFEDAVGEDYSLTIDSDAFGGCKSLSTFELPEGLKTITAGTFKGCTSLVTIVIPSTVELIENNAFSGCTKLANVIFAEPAEGTTRAALEIADGTYNETETSGPTGVSQSSVFYNCPALKSISFPEGMTRLGQYVFYKSALESVELPSTLAEMGKYAFAYTDNLETVTFRTNDDGKAALTKIPERAFYQSKKLASVTIPEGVTEIEMWAFYYCTDLATVTLPSTLVEIGSSAFNKCILTDFTIAEGSVLETIGSNAFAGTKFTSFTVPATVKTIDSSAFSGCNLLSSVTFTVGEDKKSVLEKIGDSAFANTALTEMILPETVDTLKLGTSLFSSCKSINKIYLPSTVASITNVFTGCKADFTVEIAEDNPNMAVDSVYPIIISPNKTEMLFAYRQLNLENGLLEISDGYTTIKQNAFASQSGIVKLSLPYTLVTLETGAFHDCDSLEEVEFRSKNNQTAFETMAAATSSSTSYGVFQNCYSLSKINLPSNDLFKVIGDKAFANCYSLETITIPKGIETIGSTAGTGHYSAPTTSTVGAFGRCFALKSVTLPSTLKKLNDYTFANCTSLSEITIPTGIEKIGIGVFALCESLQTVDISKCTKLTEIGNGAFRESGLTSFEVPKSVTKLGTGTSSYGYVFYKCENLKTVTFAAGIKLSYVLANTFAYSGIETIDLSAALTSTATLGVSLFESCEYLTDVKLPSALTALGNSMFKNCTSLTGVKLDSNGNPVIENGDYVYTLELPEKLVFMGTYTFQGSGLVAIKIPAGIEGLASTKAYSAGSGIKYDNYNKISSVFLDCLNLNKVVFLGNPALIGQKTFSGCASLETIVAKDIDGYTADGFFKNLKYVGDDVFRGTAIKEANFDALERMGNYMFAESALEKVTFANSVIYNGKSNGWGKYAFSECKNLKGVELDENGDPVMKNGDYVYTIQLPAANYYSTYTFSESGLIAIKFPAGTTALISSASSNSNSSIYTFKNCTDLKKVVFEGKVTLIGGYAFDGCTSLSAMVGSDGEEASFFGNLTSVGANAFKGTAVTKATLTNLTTMGDYAFAESKIEEVSFGKKLTSGKYAFEKCKNLATVTLSDEQDKIFASMFSQCSALNITQSNTETAGIVLPDAIKTIDANAFASAGISGTVTLPKSLTLSGLSKSAFWNCNISAYALGNNTNFSVNNGVLFDAAGTKLISVPKKYSGALDLSNVTDIAANAFVFCDSITSVTFPAAPEAIPDSAFKYWYMSDDMTYTIPSTVKTIGANAFDGSNLKGELVIPEGVTSIGNYAFQNTDITSVVIPSTVKSIGTYAFSGCESLTTVKFTVTDGVGIEEIGGYAFKGSGLTEITLPATLAYTKNEDAPNGETNIGGNAFENCVDLKTVVVEEGIVKLGNPSSTSGSKLFYNSGVESVTLPSTLEIIGQYTFAGTKLTSVTLPNTMKTIASYAFQYAPLTGTLVIPEGVGAIGIYAFMGKAREAVLDEDGNETGEYDYTGCSTIQKIVLPESCVTVDTSSFANLYDLAEVNLENVQKIGNGAFAYAGAKLSESEGLELTFSALTSITATDPTIKDGVKTENGNGPFAFVKIAKATFETETSMKGRVFCETAYLGEVVLPDGVTVLPKELFAFSPITEITIPATVEVMNDSVFEGCLSLTKVTFEEGSVLKTMDYYAFYNCISLTDLVLPDSLESISHNAFSYCASLKSVVIPYNVVQQNNNPLFTGWTADQTIYFRIEEEDFYSSFFADTLKNCEAKVVYGYKG